MELKNYLEQLGLDGRKADVYLAALELGSGTVIEIARKARIKRTTCYDILLNLIDLGYISETAKGKRRLFIGEDPEKIKKDLRKKEGLITEILPMLKSMYNVKGVKPKIRYYEGLEGLKEVYDDTLKYRGEILSFASEEIVSVLGRSWTNDYIKRRVKKEIKFRAILKGSDIISRDFVSQDQLQLRTSKLVNPEKYPFSIEINLYGFSKVAMISAKESTAMIIESTEIFNTLKLIFNLCWDLLPEVKRS
jgi:sugar-specific transcriptional regulator TrmB